MALAPSDMFCFSLYTASHAMQQAYRSLLEDVGVTYPQYLVLSALWTSGEPLSVSGIGKQVHLDSSTLTPLLKRLEAAGLVVRSRDARDERQVLVNLTPEGKKMQERAAHIPACIIEKTGLEEAALGRLQAELSNLADHLRQGSAASSKHPKKT